MSVHTQTTLCFVFDEVVSAVANDEFVQLPQVTGLLYNMRTSMGRRERYASVSGLGEFSQKNETAAATEANVVQQFESTFVHQAWALQTRVSREVIDDEQWGWFQDLGVKLADAANRTMETRGSLLFNDSFDGTTFLAEDGLSICNSAHLNVDSGNSQDNAGANALTTAGIKSTRDTFRAFTDYTGQRVSLNPDMLLVPIQLETDAWEIVRSNLKPGGANNDANFYQGLFDLVVWNYLSDANDWWMLDSRQMARNLFWHMRTGLEIFGEGDLFAGTRKIGGYMRFSNGCTDWRWIYGNEQA
jgi:phage major head subunit gpT-like protein